MEEGRGVRGEEVGGGRSGGIGTDVVGETTVDCREPGGLLASRCEGCCPTAVAAGGESGRVDVVLVEDCLSRAAAAQCAGLASGLQK